MFVNPKMKLNPNLKVGENERKSKDHAVNLRGILLLVAG
jgi:hypothetical protein